MTAKKGPWTLATRSANYKWTEDAKIRLEAGESLKAQAGKTLFAIMVEMTPQQVLGQVTK